ncbi:MAG: hypothetical protein ACREBJ_10330 [Nitrosotalea sp.]
MQTKRMDKQKSGMGLKIINEDGLTLARVRFFPGKSVNKKNFYTFYNQVADLLKALPLENVEDNGTNEMTMQFSKINPVK